MADVISIVERVTGLKVPVKIGPRRGGDAVTLIADPAKARARFKMSPSHSDLVTIIDSAWKWHRRDRSL